MHKISELQRFDATEYLSDSEEMTVYLSTALQEDDPALLAAVLEDCLVTLQRQRAAPPTPPNPHPAP